MERRQPRTQWLRRSSIRRRRTCRAESMWAPPNTSTPSSAPISGARSAAIRTTICCWVDRRCLRNRLSDLYVQGGVNVGTTQYIDAFQRANFWGTVSSNPNYHLLLGGPTVLAEQTLSPPARYGKTASAFGFKAGEVDINWFDGQLQTLMTNLGIQANSLPIFLTYNVYLTHGGCCIGGYHSYTGSVAYMHATYVSTVGAFSQNVSALSHEIGEWADDPLTNNTNVPSACGILEVGDPLENNPNYGDYPYSLGGFTYDLQDLVTVPYFGAPPSTSVDRWSTFQGETLSVCQNGG